MFFFFLMIRRPPRSTLFPTRRSSDLCCLLVGAEQRKGFRRELESAIERQGLIGIDRKSTRLNSSHQIISYAVFCLKKKKTNGTTHRHSQTEEQVARAQTQDTLTRSRA